MPKESSGGQIRGYDCVSAQPQPRQETGMSCKRGCQECFILRTIKVVFWRFSGVPFAVRACAIDRHGRHLKAVLTAFFQTCERKVRRRKEKERE